MRENKKKINLSRLVEKRTIWDDPYLKNIWINLDSLDLIRISEGIDTREDLENSYIDIENNPEDFVCMPGKEAINKNLFREIFVEGLKQSDRDQFFKNYKEYSTDAAFLDLIYELGLENELNDFRKKVAAKILYDWALDEGIPINVDIDFSDIHKRDI
jgi:hypothetical protein